MYPVDMQSFPEIPPLTAGTPFSGHLWIQELPTGGRLRLQLDSAGALQFGTRQRTAPLPRRFPGHIDGGFNMFVRRLIASHYRRLPMIQQRSPCSGVSRGTRVSNMTGLPSRHFWVLPSGMLLAVGIYHLMPP